MKKFFLITMICCVSVLAACSGFNLSTSPTVAPEQAGEDTDLATRVSKILTVAATQGYQSPTPTLMVTEEGEKGPSDPTATATLVPTETIEPSPTAVPTEAPTATLEVTPTEAATATIIPTAVTDITPIPTTTDDPAAALGPATASDPMDSAALWSWPTVSDQYSSAIWANGSMRITALSTTAGWRLPAIDPLGNMYLEMTAHSETCSGKDSYGIFFHVPDNIATSGYWFIVSCDGNYRLAKWDGSLQTDGKFTALIDWTASKVIRQGAGQPNRLGVLVKGSNLSVYVNGYLLKTIQEATYPSGYFGVFVNGKNTTNYTVNFDEISYWKDPQ